MKHTLKICTLICTALLGHISLRAQYLVAPRPPQCSFVSRSGITLLQVVDSMYAMANPSDTTEGGELDQIQQFKSFWETRVVANDTTISAADMFSRYYSALSGALSSTSCSSGGFDGNWVPVGPNNVSNEVGAYCTTVWADPSNENYILAGSQAGLFKTTNGGTNWTCISDPAPIAGPTMYVNCIAVNPLNKNEIYFGTNGAGMMKTFDGGATWFQELILPGTETIGGIFFSPDSTRLYAFNQDYVFTRSTVGTFTPWVDITPPGISSNCRWVDFQFVPGNQNHFFISNVLGDSKQYQGVWYATNSVPGSSDWSRITTGMTAYDWGTLMHDTDWIITKLSMPDADTLFFASIAKNGLAALLKYSISGSNVIEVNNSMPYGSYAGTNGGRFGIAVTPISSNNAHRRNVYYGTDAAMKSYDGGISFNYIGKYWADYTHADIRGLFLQKSTNTLHGDSDVVFFASDGGISKKPAGVDDSISGDMTTININGSGLNCGTFWGFAIGEADAGIGGMMHDGVVTYEPSLPQKWVSLGSADSWGAQVDKAVPTKGYVEFWADDLNCTAPAGGRQMGTSTYFPNPPYSIDAGYGGVGHAIATYDYGIYSLGSDLWRKKATETSFSNMDDPPYNWGFPDKAVTHDTFFCAGIAFDPHDTTFNGYIMYNVPFSPWRIIYYRNPHLSTYWATAHTIPTLPPGVSGAYYPFSVGGIATDPNNTERLWISQNGWWSPTDTVAIFKVQYSSNHGNSWVDISLGLPITLSIGKLIFDDANNTLYCTNDLGIYKCDLNGFDPSDTIRVGSVLQNLSVLWTCFNQGAVAGQNYPHLAATDMRIDHCEGKLYACSFGRSVWATDLYPSGATVGNSDIISVNPTIWNGGHKNWYIDGSIEVKPGVTFTITNGDTVHMPRGGRIIIDSGAHLVIDGAEITNSCSNCFWQGIEAHGNTGVPQDPYTNQGWVTVKNGSTITNAIMGICNYDPNVGFGSTGGIIQATGSYFVNNQNSIAFSVYDNWHGTVLCPNRSYFSICTFLLDSNYKGDAIALPFTSHVNLNDVEGINFTGCQFLNRDNNTLDRLLGEGIHARNSGFYVGPYCNPLMIVCPSPYPSRFCGFTNGISIQGALGYSPTINIDRNLFDSVSVGVNITANSGASVTRNTFGVGHGNPVLDISSKQFSGCYQNIGILIKNIPQFTVQENNFQGFPNHSLSNWYNFGTVVTNTGAVTNHVYKCTFDSLTFGVYAVGGSTDGLSVDYSYPGPPNPFYFQGLVVNCNAFSNDNTDIMVAKGDTGVAPQGINVQQAGIDIPTKNTFSGSSMNVANYCSPLAYYWDLCCMSVEYPYHMTTFDTTIFPVNGYPATCPSLLPPLPGTTTTTGTGTLGTPLAVLTSHKQLFNSNKSDLLNTVTQYNSLMDFGNALQLIYTIDTSTSHVTLYNTLRQGVPYISELALKVVADSMRLTYSEMLNILLLVPDDLRDPTFLSYVNKDYNFNQADLDSLQKAAQNSTTRTALARTMNNAQLALSNEANIIMMMLKSPYDTSLNINDTTGSGICADSNSVYYMLDSNSFYFGFDSVDQWLRNIGQTWTYFERVGYYNSLGKVSVADSIFQSAGRLFSSSSPLLTQKADSAIYATYTPLWTAIKSAEADGRNKYQLNADEIATLDTSLETVTFNTARLVTRSIVVGDVGTISAMPCPIIAVGTGIGLRHGNDGNNGQTFPVINSIDGNKQFSVYPNPTSGIVTFSYNVPDAQNLKVIVTNLFGEKVMEQYLGNNAGSINWNPNSLPAGVYIYQASGSNGIIRKGKLIVIR